MHSARRQMQDLLAPILKERRDKMALDPELDMPCDMLSWTIKDGHQDAFDPEVQMEYQLGIGEQSKHSMRLAYRYRLMPFRSAFAAIDTMSVGTTLHTR